MLRSMKVCLCLCVAGLGLAGCGQREAAAPAPVIVEEVVDLGPEIGPWGFPFDTMDTSIAPGNDFFLFANGTWLAQTPIPADRTGIGFSVVMRERNQARLTAIIDDLQASYPLPGSDAQKIRDLYQSYLDEARIEITGMAPFDPAFERIRAVETHAGLAQIMADAEMGVGGPINAYVGLDAKAPAQSVVMVSQSGLGLPDRLFYLGKGSALDGLRAGYLDYITSVFDLLGKDYAHERAADMLALETEIARLHWSRVAKRDVTRTYNPATLNELVARAPDFPWADYLANLGLGDADRVVVREEDAVIGLAELFAKTPVSTWRDYLAFHYVRVNATYMPRRFSLPHFDFFRHKLRGQRARRSRESRAVGFVNSRLEHAVGEIYVERYVTEEARTQMMDMFANIKRAYRARIETLEWMSDDTKLAALAKLDAMQAEIGYPRARRTYEALEIDAYDLFGNVRRMRADTRAWNLQRLERGLDRDYWTSAPQTVNAFYNHSRNTVFVPAGYVQSPLFDAAADTALNYGAIGSIIGHEIGHGFDDRGSHYDADGRLTNWWSDADRRAFQQLGDRLADQFDEYEVLPGLFVNGRQTLGENIGDLAGVQVAYDAYMLSLKGEEPPKLDGFTGPQRFFLGRAQARRYKRTEENVRRRVLSDNHSPMSLRVNAGSCAISMLGMRLLISGPTLSFICRPKHVFEFGRLGL